MEGLEAPWGVNGVALHWNVQKLDQYPEAVAAKDTLKKIRARQRNGQTSVTLAAAIDIPRGKAMTG